MRRKQTPSRSPAPPRRLTEANTAAHRRNTRLRHFDHASRRGVRSPGVTDGEASERRSSSGSTRPGARRGCKENTIALSLSRSVTAQGCGILIMHLDVASGTPPSRTRPSVPLGAGGVWGGEAPPSSCITNIFGLEFRESERVAASPLVTFQHYRVGAKLGV